MTDMQKVQQSLRFTSSDLAYNRRGEPSPAQLKMWKDAEQGCARNLLYIFVGIVVLTVIGSFLLQGPDRFGIFVPGGIMAVLALGGALFMRSPTPGMDKVYSVTGPARLDIDRGEKGSRHYKLMIGKTDFTIGPELYDLLEQDAAYTAHYQKLGPSHRLISLEEA
jgi:hypothetical protein